MPRCSSREPSRGWASAKGHPGDGVWSRASGSSPFPKAPQGPGAATLIAAHPWPTYPKGARDSEPEEASNLLLQLWFPICKVGRRAVSQPWKGSRGKVGAKDL